MIIGLLAVAICDVGRDDDVIFGVAVAFVIAALPGAVGSIRIAAGGLQGDWAAAVFLRLFDDRGVGVGAAVADPQIFRSHRRFVVCN